MTLAACPLCTICITLPEFFFSYGDLMLHLIHVPNLISHYLDHQFEFGKTFINKIPSFPVEYVKQELCMEASCNSSETSCPFLSADLTLFSLNQQSCSIKPKMMKNDWSSLLGGFSRQGISSDFSTAV